MDWSGGSNGLFGSRLDINISSYCDRDHEFEYISPGQTFRHIYLFSVLAQVEPIDHLKYLKY